MVSLLLPFLGACVLIAAVPGPSTVLIIRQSLRGGRRAGVMTVLGNESGVFLWGLAAAFGLTALLAASQVAYDVMRVVGAAVLIGFGVQSLRAARRGEPVEELAEEDVTPAPTSLWKSYRAGLVTNLANPKAAVFAMSFLPQFVPHDAPKLPTMVILAASWAIFEVGYYSTYVWFVSRLKSVFSRVGVKRRMEQVSGTLLVALGLRMAIEGV